MRLRGTVASAVAGLAGLALLPLAMLPLPAAAEVRQTCAVAAHRGDWSTTYTENGIPAMRHAIRGGADYLETDLRMTKDRQFVLMHDPTIRRTTNGAGWLAKTTLKRLHRFRLDDGSRVPTLQRFLRVTKPSGVHLLIEMKAMGGIASYRRLAREIRAFGRDRVRVTSRSTERLDLLASVAPGIPQAIITGRLLTPAEVAPYDAVLLHFEKMTVEWLDAMPYPVYAFTPNDAERWQATHAYRLAGVITDAPSLFLPWRTTGCADPVLAPERVVTQPAG